MSARRPLVISDCDEVLLHMIVPFRAWLDTVRGIHLDISIAFEDALRHKDSGDLIERAEIWPLLVAFFETEMDRQTPIAGAVESMARLSAHADIVILTNIGATLAPARAAQLLACDLPYRVIGNQGSKGPPLVRLVAEYDPLITFFIDDLASNHRSVARDAPETWRIHMIGEQEMAGHYPPAPDAHARIDDWATAERWIMARIDETSRVAASA